jgi:hypothetical protein
LNPSATDTATSSATSREKACIEQTSDWSLLRVCVLFVLSCPCELLIPTGSVVSSSIFEEQNKQLIVVDGSLLPDPVAPGMFSLLSEMAVSIDANHAM